MIGTVIGDVVGSVYEFDNIRRKDFPLFSEDCEATDDSIMAIAVADAIMEAQDKGAPFQQVLCEKFRSYGARCPVPIPHGQLWRESLPVAPGREHGAL